MSEILYEILWIIVGSAILLILGVLWVLFKKFGFPYILLIFEKIGFLVTVLIIYFVILMSSLLWDPKAPFYDTPWDAFRLLAMVLIVIGFSILVVGIIGYGIIGYELMDKWYVLVYAIICGIWESIIGIVTFFQLDTFIDPMEDKEREILSELQSLMKT